MRTFLARTADSDLLFILSEAEVSLKCQFDIVSCGYKSLRKFVGIEDNRAGVRRAFMADLALDPAAQGAPGAEARVTLASLVSSWEVAQSQLKHEVQQRAEAKTHNLTRPVSVQDKTSMRKAAEAAWGKIPNREAPSADYVASKLEEMEANEPVAAPLDEVTSVVDVEQASVVAHLDMTGKVQIVRKRAKNVLPSTPEEFRYRLRIERNAWLYMMVKFPHRDWIQGLTPRHWDRWTDYFLGARVMLLEIPTGSGGTTQLYPPWSIVLSYELEARKLVMQRINEDGHSMIASMEAVVRCGELKEIAFTCPLALMGRTGHNKRNPDDSWDPPGKRPRGKGKGKEKGKVSTDGKGAGPGKGKSKGKKGDGKNKGLLHMTPDGRQICFGYNDGTCTDANCGRVHVCRKRGCLSSNHTLLSCPLP